MSWLLVAMDEQCYHSKLILFCWDTVQQLSIFAKDISKVLKKKKTTWQAFSNSSLNVVVPSLACLDDLVYSLSACERSLHIWKFWGLGLVCLLVQRLVPERIIQLKTVAPSPRCANFQWIYRSMHCSFPISRPNKKCSITKLSLWLLSILFIHFYHSVMKLHLLYSPKFCIVKNKIMLLNTLVSAQNFYCLLKLDEI